LPSRAISMAAFDYENRIIIRTRAYPGVPGVPRRGARYAGSITVHDLRSVAITSANAWNVSGFTR
jgi:hypothetical protein